MISAEFINAINFDFVPSTSQPHPTCSPVGADPNTNASVICLPIAANNEEQNLAQVFELCEQFELAIRFIASENNVSVSQAFEAFAAGFITFVGPNTNQEARTAIGLMECLRERVIPQL